MEKEISKWLSEEISYPSMHSLATKDIQLMCQHEMISIWKFLTTQVKDEKKVTSIKKILDLEKKYGKQQGKNLQNLKEKFVLEQQKKQKLKLERDQLRSQLKDVNQNIQQLHQTIHQTGNQNIILANQIEKKKEKLKELKQKRLMKNVFRDFSILLTKNQQLYQQFIKEIYVKQQLPNTSSNLTDQFRTYSNYILQQLEQNRSESQKDLQHQFEKATCDIQLNDLFELLSTMLSSSSIQFDALKSSNYQKNSSSETFIKIEEENFQEFSQTKNLMNKKTVLKQEVDQRFLNIKSQLLQQKLSQEHLNLLSEKFELDLILCQMKAKFEFLVQKNQQLNKEIGMTRVTNLEPLKSKLDQIYFEINKNYSISLQIMKCISDVQEKTKTQRQLVINLINQDLLQNKVQLFELMKKEQGRTKKEIEHFDRLSIKQHQSNLLPENFQFDSLYWNLCELLNFPFYQFPQKLLPHVKELKNQVEKWKQFKNLLMDKCNQLQLNPHELELLKNFGMENEKNYMSLSKAILKMDEKVTSLQNQELEKIEITLLNANKTEELFNEIYQILLQRDKLATGVFSNHFRVEGKSLPEWIALINQQKLLK